MQNKITKSQGMKEIEINIGRELAGKQVWGDLNVSYEEYEVLQDKFRTLLSYSDVNILKVSKTYPCAFVTFMIALAYYKYLYNFWGVLGEELNISVNGPLESEIGKLVKVILKKQGFDYALVKDDHMVNLAPIFYQIGLPPESNFGDLFYALKYDQYSIFDPQQIIEDLIDLRSYQIKKPLRNFLKNFREDRALEFVVEMHDAMLCVDSGASGESRYVDNYIVWKEKERSKEIISEKKKKENQTKPYLFFENGKRGLCLVLPRTIMSDEWVDDVEWSITGNDGRHLCKKMVVFGDDGHRFIESVMVSVSPSASYTIKLIDNESVDDPVVIEWTLEGIKQNEVMFFNANGRMTKTNYLLYPFGTMIMGTDVSIIRANNVDVITQAYPGVSDEYRIVSVEPRGKAAELIYYCGAGIIELESRPQINMFFEGETLFGISADNSYRLFTEIPKVIIDVDEDVLANGFELRLGQVRIPIDQYFVGNRAAISLEFVEVREFSAHSIRLYQHNRFLKQIGFSLVPRIGTTYSSLLTWRSESDRDRSKQFKFDKSSMWNLEFLNCSVNEGERSYLVECPSTVGAINVKLRSAEEEHYFSCDIELPVKPVEISVINQEILADDENKRVKKIGLSELQATKYWASLKCFGIFKEKRYQLKLRTANGIEQVETVLLTQSGCGNFDLSVFLDTLENCPLPARIELWCDGDENMTLPVIVVADTVQLPRRPVYVSNKNCVLFPNIEKTEDFIIKRFGIEEREEVLLCSDSSLWKMKSGEIMRGYKCKTPLLDGLYCVEVNGGQSDFEFEEANNVILSNGNDTLNISSKQIRVPFVELSEWIDGLVRDVIKCGINQDIKDTPSYQAIQTLPQMRKTLEAGDYEKLIGLAFFAHGKCVKTKRESLLYCMKTISESVLSAADRLELIRMLVKIKCPAEIFDICLQEYNLYLFLGGSLDARELSQAVEVYSIELSMLMRMGIDDSIKDTIGKEKYREVIGKDAIKTLLSVPNTNNQAQIIEEQKQFLKEQEGCRIKINLTSDISGDMEPLQKMINTDGKTPVFEVSKKPDIGNYFDRIRYVDQYVNWYIANHDKNLDMRPETKATMLRTVQENCAEIVSKIEKLKQIKELRGMVTEYEDVLRARYRKNPLGNLNVCIPARYFFLQGLAAFMAKLPAEYRKYGWAIRPAEQFMIHALSIAPRMAKRDLMMASTYIYLKRKEEKLCQ